MNIIAAFTRLRKFNYLSLTRELLFFARFFLLVIFFLLFELIRSIGRMRLVKFVLSPLRSPTKSLAQRIISVFNLRSDGEISSLDLIKLAMGHLKLKKARTIITIGGMAIGFGSVIFLLSLGYGVQRLVVSRVARLDEMKQINVSVGQASSLVINDKSLTDIAGVEHVKAVIPMVSVVSKVNYNNSVSDVVAYGVTRAFLEESAIQPVRGGLFDDQELTSAVPATDQNQGQVAGATAERMSGAKLGKQLAQVRYAIYPLVWKPVYAEPSLKSDVIGYTKREVGEMEATEVWGQVYSSDSQTIEGVDNFGNVFQPWINDTLPLWKKEECLESNPDCSQKQYVIVRQAGQQALAQGYMTEESITYSRYQVVASSYPSFAEGEFVGSIQFSFKNNKWASLYSDATDATAMLNLFTTQNKPGTFYGGELVFGEGYASPDGWGAAGKNEHGATVGYWIRAKLPMWRKLDCADCKDMYLKEVDQQEQQVIAMAYVRADQAIIDGLEHPPQFGQVLGDATESASLTDVASGSADLAATDSDTDTATDSGEVSLADGTILIAETKSDGTIDWVSMASDSASSSQTKREILTLPDSAQKVAVVNRAMLKVLGIEEAQAIGLKFSSVLMLDQEFFSTPDYQAESAPADFTIVGVTPDEKTPAYYVPFGLLKSLGIENFSQAKVVVEDQNDIKQVRQTIEASGYRTSSVVDTVGKINSLFDTIRLVLSVLGMVALSVAALGMFNTLTVSLLEKTREVGLMKAIGMKSNEVKRLFLAESIVMGLSGGICGLVLSIIAGQLLSFVLSILSVTKGLGYIQLVYIPFYLGASIIGLSFVIAVVTGMYPSYRATKISALNALRYE